MKFTWEYYFTLPHYSSCQCFFIRQWGHFVILSATHTKELVYEVVLDGLIDHGDAGLFLAAGRLYGAKTLDTSSRLGQLKHSYIAIIWSQLNCFVFRYHHILHFNINQSIFISVKTAGWQSNQIKEAEEKTAKSSGRVPPGFSKLNLRHFKTFLIPPRMKFNAI